MIFCSPVREKWQAVSAPEVQGGRSEAPQASVGAAHISDFFSIVHLRYYIKQNNVIEYINNVMYYICLY